METDGFYPENKIIRLFQIMLFETTHIYRPKYGKPSETGCRYSYCRQQSVLRFGWLCCQCANKKGIPKECLLTVRIRVPAVYDPGHIKSPHPLFFTYPLLTRGRASHTDEQHRSEATDCTSDSSECNHIRPQS